MTHSALRPLLKIDPEIERSLLARLREIHQQVRDFRDHPREIQLDMEEQGENLMHNQPRV